MVFSMRALTMIFGNDKQHPVDLFPMLHAWQLKYALKSTKRAHHTPEKKYSGAGPEPYEYAHFSWGPQADGVWACCCGKENELIYYKGTYPFKYLRCERCNHHPCRTCKAALHGVLRPLNRRDTSGPVMTKAKGDFCTVCSSCGLSYRAVRHNKDVIFPRKCHCGDHFGPHAMRYRIHPADGYRRNPVKAAHKAKSTLLEAKTENISNNAKATRERQIESGKPSIEQFRLQDLSDCFEKLVKLDDAGLRQAKAQLSRLHEAHRDEDSAACKMSEQHMDRAAYRDLKDEPHVSIRPCQQVRAPSSSCTALLYRMLTSISCSSDSSFNDDAPYLQHGETNRRRKNTSRSVIRSGRMQPRRSYKSATHHTGTYPSREQKIYPSHCIGVEQYLSEPKKDEKAKS